MSNESMQELKARKEKAKRAKRKECTTCKYARSISGKKVRCDRNPELVVLKKGCFRWKDKDDAENNEPLKIISDVWLGDNEENWCPSKIFNSIFKFIYETPKSMKEIMDEMKRIFPEYNENILSAHARRALTLIDEVRGALGCIEIKKDKMGYFNSETDIKKYFVRKLDGDFFRRWVYRN